MDGLTHYYYELKRTLDETNFYQPFVPNLNVFQRHRDELVMAKFLSVFDSFLDNQVQEQILSGDTITSLSITLSRVHHVSMEVILPSVSSGVESSATATGGYGRGGGRSLVAVAIQRRMRMRT